MQRSELIQEHYNPQNHEQNLQKYCSQIFTRSKNKQYDGADQWMKKLFNYQSQYEETMIELMKTRHQEQRSDLESNCHKKMKASSDKWDQIINQDTKNYRDTVKEMKGNNKNEACQLKQEMDERISEKFKDSNQLLNLRKMEHHMSKQKQFVEARRVQDKISTLYQQQLNLYNEKKDSTIDQLLTNLKQKQNKELQLLNQRFLTDMQVKNNKKKQELELLFQTYKNNLKELSMEQGRQLQSFGKLYKNRGGKFLKDSKEFD